MIDDGGDAHFLLRAVHVVLASHSAVPEPSSLFHHSKHNGGGLIRPAAGVHTPKSVQRGSPDSDGQYFQDDLFIQLFSTLHDACFVWKSLLAGDGRTRTGRPFFPFNSAGITLIRKWKCEFVGCSHESLNFHKKKVVLCRFEIFKYCCQRLLLL